MRAALGLWQSGVDNLLLGYFLAINAFYFALLLLSALELRGYLKRLKYGSYDLIFRDPHTPPITVIVPAHNEGLMIAASVRGILNLNYPEYEVIVVNDGSDDDTLDVLRREFSLVAIERSMEGRIATRPIRAAYRSLVIPNLIVIDKENGRKADALNAGINACRTPYFCAVDADVLMDEDALLRIMRPVVEDPERVVAVGGIVRILNGCEVRHGRIVRPGLPRDAWPLFQVVEYLRAFLGGRTGFSKINGLLLISGAFGVFSLKWARLAGGYRADTVGEDMELVCDLHDLLRRQGVDYRVVFIGDPVCWTEVPSTLKVLSQQRRRWQRGLLETLSRHMRMLFRPSYGILGFFSFPYFFIFEGIGPVIEALGYLTVLVSWAMGSLDVAFAAAFLTLAVLFGMILNLCAIILEEASFHRYPVVRDFLLLLACGLLENVGYHQLSLVWRLQGIWDFCRKRRDWGVMVRSGIKKR